MESWIFVLGAVVFLAIWMLINRGNGFDPYPFILLNLVLSCIAALQGAILLIAAKRADQVSAEQAMHDYDVNTRALQIVAELKDLLEAMGGNTDLSKPPAYGDASPR